ncbi:MAG: cytochrome c3 family protein [Chloroflexota bacterium]
MRTQRLGCLTFSGLLAALFTCLVLAVLLVLQGGDMFSPGALNAQTGETRGGATSHAQAACRDCHSAPWEADRMADRCAACHTEIGAQMMEVASLHGAITHRNPGVSCGHCHPDHRGAQAALTVAALADFPHEELGFSLNGHPLRVTREPFECRDCHVVEISSFDQAVCVECHRPTNEAFMAGHVSNWGENCLACHDGIDSFGDDFDHNRFSFPLQGKHAQTSCYTCHAKARTLLELRNLPQTCAACHLEDDAHAGAYGAECGACHSSEGWKPAAFDHNLSAFKLEGEHAQVACEDCHLNGVYKGTPADCYSCHAQNDAHDGRFGMDCASCHSTSAWSPAQYNRPHAFPLDHGEGRAASCATCHPTSFTTYTCYGCHEHNESNIRAEHLEEGVSNFENCVECHPNGREHEGGGGDE